MKKSFNLFSFYHSKTWQKFRQQFIADRLARDGELKDDYTGVPILKERDAILHHKVFLTEENVNDFNISLNPDNIALVSQETHNRIHDKFNCNSRKIYITTSREKKGYYDLIVSWQSLFNAIGGNEKAILNTYQIYNLLIDNLKTNYGKWNSALVIAKDEADLKRLKRVLQAEEV